MATPAGGSRRGSRASLAQPMSPSELEAFYRRVFLPLIRRAIWKHRLGPEDARDIVQDAFVLALTRLSGAGNPRAWLIQVVDHLSINHRRKLIRRAQLSERWGFVDEGGHSLSGREEAGDQTDF